jgi:hypothetical protein
MCYWASYPLNLGETAEPLGPFISKLAQAGAKTAEQWYGVVAVDEGNNQEGASSEDPSSRKAAPWVAHGYAMFFCWLRMRSKSCALNAFNVSILYFSNSLHLTLFVKTRLSYVDIWMDPSPHGDLQWSLCPTCGAWAALSLWESALFNLMAPNLNNKHHRGHRHNTAAAVAAAVVGAGDAGAAGGGDGKASSSSSWFGLRAGPSSSSTSFSSSPSLLVASPPGRMSAAASNNDDGSNVADTDINDANSGSDDDEWHKLETVTLPVLRGAVRFFEQVR